MTKDPTYIKRIIENITNNFIPKKFDNLDEMGKFLKNRTLPKPTQNETKSEQPYIFLKNFFTKEFSGPDCFTDDFQQKFEEEKKNTTLILHKLYWRIVKKITLLNSFLRPVLPEYQDLAKTFQKKTLIDQYPCILNTILKWLHLYKDGPKVVAIFLETALVQYMEKPKLVKEEMAVLEGGKCKIQKQIQIKTL